MNCRYEARPFAMVSARSSRYYIDFFTRRITELASLPAADKTRKLAHLPLNPQTLTRHRSTAELRVVGIETSRTELLTEAPYPEWNKLAVSRLRTRETMMSPRVGLAPSLNVCTPRKMNCGTAVHSSRTAVISPAVPGTNWVYTLSHPESTNLPASVAARSV